VKPLAAVSWSGGKDGCLALHRVRSEFRLAALITMLTEDGSRTRSHGLRPEIIERHAAGLGVEAILGTASWESYETEFRRALTTARDRGISHVIFGDIFPDPHREWVERMCRETRLTAVLPLWGDPTQQLLEEFLACGGQARIVTVRASVLDASWLGRRLDREAAAGLAELGVDPCGERGEYHTLATGFPGLIGRLQTQECGHILHDGCWLLDLTLDLTLAP